MGDDSIQIRFTKLLFDDDVFDAFSLLNSSICRDEEGYDNALECLHSWRDFMVDNDKRLLEPLLEVVLDVPDVDTTVEGLKVFNNLCEFVPGERKRVQLEKELEELQFDNYLSHLRLKYSSHPPVVAEVDRFFAIRRRQEESPPPQPLYQRHAMRPLNESPVCDGINEMETDENANSRASVSEVLLEELRKSLGDGETMKLRRTMIERFTQVLSDLHSADDIDAVVAKFKRLVDKDSGGECCQTAQTSTSPPPPPPPPLCPPTFASPPPPPPPPPMIGGPMGGPPPPPPPLLGGPPPPPPPFGAPGAPPPPPLFGAPRAPAKLDLPEVVKPKKKAEGKMLKMQWTKIAVRDVKDKTDTVWGKIATSTPHTCQQISLDYSQLDELFSQQRPNTSPKSNRQAVATVSSKKTDEVVLLDTKRFMNVSIFIKKLGNVQDLIADVRECRGSTSLDTLQSLLSNAMPTQDEVELIRTYSGDCAKLAPPESFFLNLVAIPDYSLRIRMLKYRMDFHQGMEKLSPQVALLSSACQQILSSTTLLRIFIVICRVGNYLNDDSASGNAAGFKLNSLWKVIELKSLNGQDTLLHFITKQDPLCAEELKEQLSSVPEAAKLPSPSELEIEFNEIAQQGEKMEKELKNKEEAVFKEMIQYLQTHCALEISTIREQLAELSGFKKKLAEYFIERPNEFKIEECIRMFKNFLVRLEKAHSENLAREEQARKREEKSKFMNECGSVPPSRRGSFFPVAAVDPASSNELAKLLITTENQSSVRRGSLKPPVRRPIEENTGRRVSVISIADRLREKRQRLEAGSEVLSSPLASPLPTSLTAVPPSPTLKVHTVYDDASISSSESSPRSEDDPGYYGQTKAQNKDDQPRTATLRQRPDDGNQKDEIPDVTEFTFDGKVNESTASTSNTEGTKSEDTTSDASEGSTTMTPEDSVVERNGSQPEKENISSEKRIFDFLPPSPSMSKEMCASAEWSTPQELSVIPVQDTPQSACLPTLQVASGHAPLPPRMESLEIANERRLDTVDTGVLSPKATSTTLIPNLKPVVKRPVTSSVTQPKVLDVKSIRVGEQTGMPIKESPVAIPTSAKTASSLSRLQRPALLKKQTAVPTSVSTRVAIAKSMTSEVTEPVARKTPSLGKIASDQPLFTTTTTRTTIEKRPSIGLKKAPSVGSALSRQRLATAQPEKTTRTVTVRTVPVRGSGTAPGPVPARVPTQRTAVRTGSSLDGKPLQKSPSKQSLVRRTPSAASTNSTASSASSAATPKRTLTTTPLRRSPGSVGGGTPSRTLPTDKPAAQRSTVPKTTPATRTASEGASSRPKPSLQPSPSSTLKRTPQPLAAKTPSPTGTLRKSPSPTGTLTSTLTQTRSPESGKLHVPAAKPPMKTPLKRTATTHALGLPPRPKTASTGAASARTAPITRRATVTSIPTDISTAHPPLQRQVSTSSRPSLIRTGTIVTKAPLVRMDTVEKPRPLRSTTPTSRRTAPSPEAISKIRNQNAKMPAMVMKSV